MGGPPPVAPTPRRRGRVALIVAAVVVLLAAAGVGLWFLLRPPPIPDPEPAAEELAAALQAGTPADFPLVMGTSASPDEQYTQVFEQLLAAVGEDGGTVTVKSVTPVEEGDDGTATATATFAWTWPVATKTAWEYETVAQLTYPGATDGEAGTWQAEWNTGVMVPGLEPGERLAVERTEPARGEIVTTSGDTIVGMTPVHRVGIDKTRPGWDTATAKLGNVLGFDQATTDDIAAQVQAAGDKAFIEVITIRENDPEYDFDAAMAIDGVVGIPDELPLAPNRDFARAVLGSVGDATEEIIKESKGTIKAGDRVGVSGLQAAYDEQLRGVPGLAVTIEPVEGGGEGREAFTIEKKDGEPLTISLDPATQLRAEAALADITDLASAIVAIKPSTGQVLAAASGPGSEGYNTATLGQYPPGSTFKIATSLAMLRAGTTPDSTLPCTDTINVEGREFRNVPGYPASALGDAVPFRTVFANSCNTAFIAQHQAITQQQLHDAAASLGLGVEAEGFGAAGTMGDVPADASGTEHAASMIGQGQVLATPLAMATVAASVSAGHTVSPWMVKPSDEEAAEAPSGNLTADEAATLRDLMGGVVQDGSAQVLRDVPGIVGAKTGTAQFGDGTKAHVWTVAMANDLAAVVFIEEGELASTDAAPVMHEFLTGN
ncbi:penicillin-binding transpeptidase domain-containing protein [Promicromonospora panici]|uniref:penicillin-binding transpeptidase domain-containing protein n=1 Tax=Promicromonospora panici TaxID=2219658 RepID=UPI001F5D42BE|nr:penicillin-binding transpeptidase domain-containing protein [Promicromonospora panici]